MSSNEYLLSQEEARLVKYYQTAGPNGREMILRFAEACCRKDAICGDRPRLSIVRTAQPGEETVS